jgi:hypothetical protein
MTVEIEDTEVLKRVWEKHHKSVPGVQREFVLAQITVIFEGKMSYDGGLNEIHRRYGQQTKKVAKKILDEILSEAAQP